MSDKQREIIKEYCNLMQWPSMRAIAKDTGIHRNRLFRIVKGYEMKLGEYEIFQSKISHIKKHLSHRKKNFKEELKDLVTLFMDQPLKENPSALLKVRKTWMSLTEEKILASRVAEVESFIESIELQKRKQTLSLKQEKQLIVFWGSMEVPHK